MPDQPTKPGQAYCPGCNRHDVRTVHRGGQEVYVMHGFIRGGVSCPRSGLPVQR